MAWNENTMEKLHAWLGRGTWHKRHFSDEERFHLFVEAVWQEVGDLWNQTEAAEIMKREARKLHPNDSVDVIDRVRLPQGSIILNYLADVSAEKQVAPPVA